MQTSAWLILLFPLAGTVINGLGYRALPGKTVGWIGTAAIAGAFVAAVLTFIALQDRGEEHRQVVYTAYDYANSAGVDGTLSILVDPLSVFMALVVTGVSTLIHLYSVAYLWSDRGYSRFFAYLNFFVFSMLLLVLAANFLILIIGWAFVGAASYMLISFWYRRTTATSAGIKAFVINVVGDVGLVLGTYFIFRHSGTLDFLGTFDSAKQDFATHGGALTAGLILLLVGAFAKSAQVPLHTWLPDAMEGPTPVSALIHAATMVTAGVYLIARSAPIYDLTETARTVVMCIGALTLLIGAIAGCAYDDIKKVLAYSTVSQIGYMFLAVGLGPVGYVAGLAHLLAHGFFKAGLFLGAGSVMHAMNDGVDMRRFGGLWRKLPITFVTFGLGYLALIGFPFLSGYFTKDAIVEATFDRGDTLGYATGGIAVLAAGLTAFYMTRLMLMTFFGRARWEDGVHPHEAPPVMTVPMIVLAVGSVFAGFALVVAFPLDEWLAPVFGEPEEAEHVVAPLTIGLALVLVMVVGALLAYLFVGRREVPVTAPARVSFVTRAARNALYADTVNESLFMRPGQWLTRALVFFDNRGVDGAVNGLAATLGGSSSRLGRTQTGFVRTYALGMLGGAVLVAGALLAVTAG
jgi:NADH-quinone oxidoreductase subunit L